MTQPYSKREIDTFHESISKALVRIETQTVHTNGRVSWLEKMVYTAIGALFFIVPVMTWLLSDYLDLKASLLQRNYSSIEEYLPPYYQLEAVE